MCCMHVILELLYGLCLGHVPVLYAGTLSVVFVYLRHGFESLYLHYCCYIFCLQFMIFSSLESQLSVI